MTRSLRSQLPPIAADPSTDTPKRKPPTRVAMSLASGEMAESTKKSIPQSPGKNPDNHAYTINGGTLVMEASAPIRPSGNPIGVGALVTGLFLALHTPAWLVLVFYKDEIGSSSPDSEPDNTTIVLLRWLSRWLLEFTPWFANAALCVFLGVLFLYLGFATLEDPKPEATE